MPAFIRTAAPLAPPPAASAVNRWATNTRCTLSSRPAYDAASKPLTAGDTAGRFSRMSFGSALSSAIRSAQYARSRFIIRFCSSRNTTSRGPGLPVTFPSRSVCARMNSPRRLISLSSHTRNSWIFSMSSA